MKRYIIIGETKSKKNERIFNSKTHRSFPSKEYALWHEAAIMQLRGQRRGEVFKECKIILKFYHGDNLRRDSDNQESSILDTLQDAGILTDDRWQYLPRVFRDNFFDKGNPRCEIEIYEPGEKVLIEF